MQMPNGSPDHTASSLWLRPRSVSPAIPFASKAASHSSVGLERAPALLQGRGRERAPLLSALPMERQLCAGNRDDLGNLQGAGMWQPRDPRSAPAGASPLRPSQHCCRYGPRQHCSFHRLLLPQQAPAPLRHDAGHLRLRRGRPPLVSEPPRPAQGLRPGQLHPAPRHHAARPERQLAPRPPSPIAEGNPFVASRAETARKRNQRGHGGGGQSGNNTHAG